jgi:hypothetical protein
MADQGRAAHPQVLGLAREAEHRVYKKRSPRMAADTETVLREAEYSEHLRTYRGFVKGVVLFAAHALVILLLLYYFFA